MGNISELFEFLSNCDKEKLFTEMNGHFERLITKNGMQAIRQIKFDVQNLNTFFGMSGWYFEMEFPRMIDEKNPNSKGDRSLPDKDIVLYTNSTSPYN